MFRRARTESPEKQRGVTFQSSEERASEMKQWKIYQAQFRREQEEIWRQEHLEAQKNVNMKFSNRLLAWFIITFLAIIPLLSTYKGSHDPNNGGVRRKKTPFAGGFFSAKETTNSNETAEVDYKSQTEQEEEPMLVWSSMSHVDYTAMGTPKSTILKQSSDGDGLVAASAGCSSASTQPKEIKILNTKPFWTLQKGEINTGAAESANLSFSWTSVALIRHNTSIPEPGEESRNETVVGVAMLDDLHQYFNQPTLTKKAAKTATAPLDFVQVQWNLEQESPNYRTDEDCYYEVRLIYQVACSTVDQQLAPSGLIAWVYSHDNMTFANLPAIRSSSTARSTDPFVPPLPRNTTNSTTNSDDNSTAPIPKVLFFGSDETYSETEAIYQYYRAQYEDDTMNSTERDSGSISPGQRIKKLFQRSIPKLLRRKRHNVDHRGNRHGKPLVLHHVQDLLDDLEAEHGSELEAKGKEPIVLVVGSSFYDAWDHEEREMKDLATMRNFSVATGTTRHLRRRLHELLVDTTSGIHSDEKSPSLEEVVKLNEKSIQQFEDDHLLGCHQFVNSLRSRYPHVELVWRLPLFVPDTVQSSQQLWQIEEEMMKTWNVPTWNLYHASYVAWVEQQMHLVKAAQSATRPSTLSSQPQAVDTVEYDLGFYQELAEAAMLEAESYAQKRAGTASP